MSYIPSTRRVGKGVTHNLITLHPSQYGEVGGRRDPIKWGDRELLTATSRSLSLLLTAAIRSCQIVADKHFN
ncbi:hypothetical protein J6590_065014 [Homalodisca vitripennis]|nr:hypothetical protein J6590_065014 [Homalodisca vitripennis]